MKKIITLIVALLAIATGAWADKTVINYVEITASPDFSTIPKLGASVQTKPTVTVTKGAPAYFNLSNGNWRKKNGDEWVQVSSGIFTPGTWRFQTQIRIDGDDAFFYVLSETPTVKVNGEEWQVNSYFYGVGDDYSCIPVYSPEYVVEEGDLEPRTVITEIEATSDIASIPEVGGTPIDPTFNVTTGVPAYFEDWGWERKNEYGAFIRDNNDTFTPGSWNYSCYVRIPDDEALKYEFQNPTVKVNGETWTVKDWTDTQIFVESTEYDMNIHATGISINPTILKFNDIGQTAQVTATLQPEDATVYYYFGTTNSNVAQVDYRSGVVTANGFGTCQIYAYTKEEPSKIAYCYVRVESVPKVSLVKGISTDLPNLPVIGEPLETKPTISVIKGVPAYFCIDDVNGWWQKKVGNEWQYVFGNTFTSGTWRFECLCVDLRLERVAQRLIRVFLPEEVGLAHEEALLVVLRVDKPAGDVLRLARRDLARLRIEDVNALDLDANHLPFFDDLDVGLSEDDE